jgi:hypothetical protein
MATMHGLVQHQCVQDTVWLIDQNCRATAQPIAIAEPDLAFEASIMSNLTELDQDNQRKFIRLCRDYYESSAINATDLNRSTGSKDPKKNWRTLWIKEFLLNFKYLK